MTGSAATVGGLAALSVTGGKEVSPQERVQTKVEKALGFMASSENEELRKAGQFMRENSSIFDYTHLETDSYGFRQQYDFSRARQEPFDVLYHAEGRFSLRVYSRELLDGKFTKNDAALFLYRNFLSFQEAQSGAYKLTENGTLRSRVRTWLTVFDKGIYSDLSDDINSPFIKELAQKYEACSPSERYNCFSTDFFALAQPQR